ncbi:hypothetical protein FOA52_008149 [Chlamydomonas sp. UWO 241]|nr:hypothetical protein FOA52_008149 [Chlamydomonas sp. UWO 241]
MEEAVRGHARGLTLTASSSDREEAPHGHDVVAHGTHGTPGCMGGLLATLRSLFTSKQARQARSGHVIKHVAPAAPDAWPPSPAQPSHQSTATLHTHAAAAWAAQAEAAAAEAVRLGKLEAAAAAATRTHAQSTAATGAVNAAAGGAAAAATASEPGRAERQRPARGDGGDSGCASSSGAATRPPWCGAVSAGAAAVAHAGAPHQKDMHPPTKHGTAATAGSSSHYYVGLDERVAELPTFEEVADLSAAAGLSLIARESLPHDHDRLFHGFSVWMEVSPHDLGSARARVPRLPGLYEWGCVPPPWRGGGGVGGGGGGGGVWNGGGAAGGGGVGGGGAGGGAGGGGGVASGDILAFYLGCAGLLAGQQLQLQLKAAGSPASQQPEGEDGGRRAPGGGEGVEGCVGALAGLKLADGGGRHAPGGGEGVETCAGSLAGLTLAGGGGRHDAGNREGGEGAGVAGYCGKGPVRPHAQAVDEGPGSRGAGGTADAEAAPAATATGPKGSKATLRSRFGKYAAAGRPLGPAGESTKAAVFEALAARGFKLMYRFRVCTDEEPVEAETRILLEVDYALNHVHNGGRRAVILPGGQNLWNYPIVAGGAG